MSEQTYPEPGYLSLFASGELARRAEMLESRLAACDICPRACGVNRLAGERGFCNTALLPAVSSAVAHHGEEPVLSGINGSGTIFFGNCNLQCVFCQNYQISQDPAAQRKNEIPVSSLAEKMLYLQDTLNCHNINLVSPTHVVPQIIRALLEAIPEGLRLPLVYNTGSYDSLETVRALDGIVDIYLPDIKYSSNEAAFNYSRAQDYVERSRAAIREMYRQVGNLVTDDEDIAVRGMIVRHLILPNRLAGSLESLAGWPMKSPPTSPSASCPSTFPPPGRRPSRNSPGRLPPPNTKKLLN
jgi:putative pyruvate formate lyase activating enzyme